jgi:hypothetical protein
VLLDERAGEREADAETRIVHAGDGRSWVKRSKMRSCASAGMPRPLSVTEATTMPSATFASSAIRPRLRRVLGALVRRLSSACVSRVASPRTRIGRSARRRRARAGAVDRVARRLDAEGDHATEVDQLVAQQDLAGGDAADVEQVVDEVGEVAELAVDDARRLLPRRRASRSSCISETALRIGASGLRSSCASMAMNSCIRRPACSTSCSGAARSGRA